MIGRRTHRALAILLTLTIIVPGAFFIVPQRASAQSASGLASCTGGALGALGSMLGLGGTALGNFLGVPVANATISGATTGTAMTTAGNCVTEVILKPLARQLIRQILQQITQNTINWISGRGNGTGSPSFVVNLSLNLQQLGDAVALPFINQVRMVLSPAFGVAIASSLLTNYAQQTSVGGFLAANRSTLGRVSPNQAAFLAGNFSQGGGIPAWFALTTQNQNNPYTLYYSAERQLGKSIAEAQTNRRQDLTQSGGFLSWCGTSAEADAAQAADCANVEINSGTNCGVTTSGVNPGDTCTVNGVEGKVKTPGSVIHDFTKKAVADSGMDQLINSNDLDASITAIFGALIQRGISEILGGTGLFGIAQPSSVRPVAITNALQAAAAGNATSISSASAAANAKITAANTYSTAWTTIGTAANSASAAVTTLKSSCASQASVAQEALDSLVTPMITQAQTNLSLVSTTQAFAQTVLSEASSNASALTTDVQRLSGMLPTAVDLSTAQAQAATTGGASAYPAGSLGVSGGSYVDQMNLIASNAQALVANGCSSAGASGTGSSGSGSGTGTNAAAYTTYTTAWGTIRAAATVASTTVASLRNSCTSRASEAATALSDTGLIRSVLTQAQANIDSVSATNPPTAAAVTSAQAQATATTPTGATATPTGSLNVSSSNGTLLDQMNLITTNAQTCT